MGASCEGGRQGEESKEYIVDKLVVACVQQRMHLPFTLDEYREDVRRFLRVAVAKNARLVIFPELGGVMVAPPILGDFRSTLLKRADLGRRRRATLWQKIVGGISRNLATALHADFRISIAALLDVAADDVWQAYTDVFGGLAREFGITIVGPGAYLPDPLDGVIRNLACAFGSQGELLGNQAKVVLHPEDVDIAQAGSGWDVIPTEVGRLGVILGSDVLYPEVGRLLAYQGADALIALGACTDPVLYNKIRAGILARMQDNQLFSAASFLVGDNELSRVQRAPFVGKSAILAPQELTPRLNGVLVEMGTHRSEGVLTAEWDFVALKRLWETSDTPVRQQVPLEQAGLVLAQLYARLQSLPLLADTPMPSEDLGQTSGDGVTSREIRRLDDLAVVSSYTSRWPLVEAVHWETVTEAPAEDQGFSLSVGDGRDDFDAPVPGESQLLESDMLPLVADDETDEMDALPHTGDMKTSADPGEK